MKTAIHIIGKGIMTATGNRFFLVSSSQYETTNRAYIVEQHAGHLTCNCPARKPCKHIKLVAEHLNAERKEAAQQAEDDRLGMAVGGWFLDQHAAKPAIMCEMCQEQPATHLDGQPRCDACEAICKRYDERKAGKVAPIVQKPRISAAQKYGLETAPIESGFDLRNVLAFQSEVA